MKKIILFSLISISAFAQYTNYNQDFVTKSFWRRLSSDSLGVLNGITKFNLGSTSRLYFGNLWQTGSSNNYFAGNVGIRTNNPSSPLTIASTSALESAPLGSELTDANNWTSTGWTGSFNSFTHNTGNTSALSRTMTNTIGQLYQVTFTISGRTAGSFTVDLGGQNSIRSYSTDGTYGYGPKVVSTNGALNFNPTSDFDGTISNISVKLITGTYSPTYTLMNSAGGNALEIRSTTNGLNNVFIGTRAGRYTTTGNNNSAMGQDALYSNTTGYNNSAVGVYALSSNTTGYNNSAVGVYALSSNTTGYYNSALGVAALQANTTGYNNSALGMNALYSNTTGYYNSALGVYSLYANTTGFNNSALGVNALGSNTTGYYNSALGVYSLYANTTGFNNSALGMNALYSNTTGYYNSALGVAALQANTTGYSNSALGMNALYSNTTGYYNSALGVNALQANTTGNNNSALGRDAGRFIANGVTPNQTSNNSLYLGYNTRAFADGQTNEIVIGADNTGLGSNTVVLGNSSIVTTALRGKVGMGTTTFLRSAKMQLNGMGMISDTLWVGNNSTYSYIKPGDANWTVSSDITKKENITLINDINLSNFSKVNPIEFSYKKENFIKDFTDEESLSEAAIDSLETVNLIEADKLSKLRYRGFSAQEFNQLLLNKNSAEIDYNDIIIVMWKKIQELESRVKALEEKK